MCGWRRRDERERDDHYDDRKYTGNYKRHGRQGSPSTYFDDIRHHRDAFDEPHHPVDRYDRFNKGFEDRSRHDPRRPSYDDRECSSRRYRSENRHSDASRDHKVHRSREDDAAYGSRKDISSHSSANRFNSDDSHIESKGGERSSNHVSYDERRDYEAENPRRERESFRSDASSSNNHNRGRYYSQGAHEGTSVSGSENTKWYSQRHGKQAHISGRGDDNASSHTHSRRRHEYNAKDSRDDENGATILVRNLGSSIMSEDVESAVSDICIQNGFSAPNSVILRSSQSGYGGMGDVYTEAAQPQSSNGYGYGAPVEFYAVVTFPSPANAARFMECMKSRKIDVNGADYYVEYDTLSINADKDSTQKPLTYDDMNELAALMKKRASACDWMCPSCSFVNFARRQACLTCNLAKPSEDVLQSQNLLVDSATTAQAQMMHSNTTDLSPWIVLKSIPLDADPSKLVFLVCSTIPGGAAQLHRCIYVIDTQPQSRRGFMFCQFASISPIENHLSKRGDKVSEILPFQGGYLRLDTVRSLEKQLVEELFKGIKMNTLKVNYEFHNETFQMTLLQEEPTAKTTGNKEARSCKIRTTNVGAVQQACSSHNAPPGAQQYLNAWLCRAIGVPGGKPDTANMTYDPKTDYFYDHRLGVYYDAASGYYISVSGLYYIWDEGSSSLILASQSPGTTATNGVASGPQQSPTGGCVAGLLESALKVAQMTNESTHKSSSSVETAKPPSAALRPAIEVSQTFDVSDDECDMEVDTTKGDAGIASTSEEPKGSVHSAAPTVRSLIICFVCLRMFEEQHQLEIHERRSEYHRAMLDAVSFP